MLTRRTFFATSAAALAASTLPVFAQSTQSAPIFTDGGAAIRGTDVVAYFTDGAPAKGSKDYTHNWQGATWQFSSAANRDAFAANPEAYAPQYGGNCAWAVSQGYTAPVDPDAWKIVDGKLYLNYSRRIQRRWERDVPGNIEAANGNWPKIVADNS